MAERLPIMAQPDFEQAASLNEAGRAYRSPLPVSLAPGCHRASPVLTSYKDGVLRLFCATCGFEAFRIAVASQRSPDMEVEGE